MKNNKIEVTCFVCGKKMFDFVCRAKRRKTGLYFCSKECRRNKKATLAIYEKCKKTMKEKYGYENNFQKPETVKKIFEKRNELEIMNKKEATFLLRYGVKNPQQVKQFRQKTKDTNLKKYKSTCAMNSTEVRDRIKQAELKRSGVDHVWKSKRFQVLIESRNEIKYGDKHFFRFSHKGFQDNLMSTYGVKNCMHIPEVAERVFSHRFRRSYKEYAMPSGKIIKLQGFECVTLKRLLEKYKEEEIYFRKCDVPKIIYVHKGIERRYYPDFFIPKENKIIETKSTYTLFGSLKKDILEINLLKFSSVLKQNFSLEIDIVLNEEKICTLNLVKIEDLQILKDPMLRLLK